MKTDRFGPVLVITVLVVISVVLRPGHLSWMFSKTVLVILRRDGDDESVWIVAVSSHFSQLSILNIMSLRQTFILLCFRLFCQILI